MSKEEEVVRAFYDNYGWVKKDGVSGETALFRDFSPAYYPYHDRVNARTMACFGAAEGRLLLAGGGDLPETHVAIATKFNETTCLDISKVAIDIARNKLANRGEFVVASILDIPKPDNHFDAVYCPHVIYHIGRDHQAKAVRELIRVTNPGRPIVIIYANPDSLPIRMNRWKRAVPGLWRLARKKPTRPDTASAPPLYFFTHPLKWWDQFKDQCDIDIQPWDVMSNDSEDALLINDTVASLGYRLCSWLENKHPHKAARWWQYPLIVLKKRH